MRQGTLVVTAALALACNRPGQMTEKAFCQPQACTTDGAVLDQARTALRRVNPDYPPGAFRAGLQGVVEIDAVVDAEGRVVSACCISGPTPLRAAAAEAATGWVFETAAQGAASRCATTRLAFSFRIH